MRKTFKSLCEQNNIDYQRARNYKNNHKELTKDEVIQFYLCESKTFKQKCEEAGVDYNKATSYRHNHPELTEEEIIKWYLSPFKKISFREMCENANISYQRAVGYRRLHSELSEEEVVDIIKERVSKDAYRDQIREICKKEGIEYKNVLRFYRNKLKNTNLSPRDVVALYKNNFKSLDVEFAYIDEDKSYFVCCCEKCGLKDILTVEEMIEHCKIHKEG